MDKLFSHMKELMRAKEDRQSEFDAAVSTTMDIGCSLGFGFASCFTAGFRSPSSTLLRLINVKSQLISA